MAPDTNSVNYRGKDVTFTFDEQINDRGAGESDLDNFFLVSPNDGPPRVRWHRTRIEVRPRHGFRPNTAVSATCETTA